MIYGIIKFREWRYEIRVDWLRAHLTEPYCGGAGKVGEIADLRCVCVRIFGRFGSREKIW